jgi:hypothetical protein
MSTPLQYLDRAMNALRDLNLVPEKTEETPIVALLNQISDKPPAPGLGVTLARLYIHRARWAKGLLAMVALVAVIWGSYTLFVSGPQARRLAAIPRVIEGERQTIVQEAAEADVKARAEQLAAAGKAALQAGKLAAAEQTISELQALRAQLEQTYELRIVSRPDERSGVWRVPQRNPQARNFYIIVEAVTPDGTVLELPVTNEEDGQTSMVKKWGRRVDEQLFRQIAGDQDRCRRSPGAGVRRDRSAASGDGRDIGPAKAIVYAL